MPTPHLRPARYGVQHIKHLRIPMADGVHLSADLFMPQGEGPFPAVLEYLPYRKDDHTAARWNAHFYFAERGFVGVCVDMRGTGASAGISDNEYLPQEQADACAVIDWLSRQPWCNGNVGMFGTSYGGFNAIQTAMHNPPALKAIIPHAATDDRYNDDVHYSGGCYMAMDQALYPAWMVALNALPPLPEYAGGEWATAWRSRLEETPPWLFAWLHHQTDDSYWQQGSLKTDYSSIKCPVLHLGGWADGYTNPVFRMAEKLTAPNRAIVGPWQHSRPNVAYPGPNIDHLHEMTRWWAQWLRGEETGIMAEDQLALYIQQGAAPHPFLPHMPGHWRYEAQWPPVRQQPRPLYLAAQQGLTNQVESGDGEDRYRYRATVGVTAGFWWPAAPPYGLARDQGADEVRSLCYTSPVLDEAVEILGHPQAVLYVSSTARVAFFSVKISDIAPDGSSTLVTRAILNATHRAPGELAHRQPEPLTPGEIYELTINLKVISWIFQPGHRIRVAIANADFPTIWPSPEPAVSTIYRGSAHPSRIILPIVEGAEAASAPEFLAPPTLAPTTEQADQPPQWVVHEDVYNERVTVETNTHHRLRPLRETLWTEDVGHASVTASDARPDLASVKGVHRISMIWPESRIDVTGRTLLRSNATHFHADVTLNVTVDGEPFFQKQWLESVERQLL